MGGFYMAGVATGFRDTWREGWSEGGVVHALRATLWLAVLISWEALWACASVPAGLDAWWQRREARAEYGGLHLNVRYGSEERQVLDYYKPAGAMDSPDGEAAARQARLVVYVHGGAWGSGAKWHYAGLARRLRRESGGAVGVAVVQYGLHRARGDVAAMTRDVDAAVTWAMCEAEANLGGAEVVLAGQSSGAHLCALSTVRRALALSKSKSACPEGREQLEALVLVSGVFDCWEHYWHEHKRGVHLLSPMLPAMGGQVNLKVHPGQWARKLFMQPLVAHSPTRILLNGAQQGNNLARHLPKRVHLLHGDADTTVPVAQSADFCSALGYVGMGNVVRLDVLEGAGHAQLLLDVMANLGGSQLNDRGKSRKRRSGPPASGPTQLGSDPASRGFLVGGDRKVHARWVAAAMGGTPPPTAD